MSDFNLFSLKKRDTKNDGIFHLDTVSQPFSLLIGQSDCNDVEGERKDNVESSQWRDLRTAERHHLVSQSSQCSVVS